MIAIWTDFAWQMLSQTSDYILSEFGFKAYESFLNDVDAGVATIKAFPNSGKREPTLVNKILLYRSVVINNYNKIVYFVDNETNVIVISDFWDTRQEPTTLASSI